MWKELRNLGLDPATATADPIPDFTMGDLRGPVDLLCHELVRRFRAESFLTSIFSKRIDYYERFPIFDWRDFPTLKINPGTTRIDYGPGDVAKSETVIDMCIAENALECTTVPYGYPTIHTLIGWFQQYLHSQGVFKVRIAGGQPFGIAHYSRPGNISAFVEPDEKTGRAIWNTRVPWIFTMYDLASTQKNENVTLASP
jgi:hypothetical protein